MQGHSAQSDQNAGGTARVPAGDARTPGRGPAAHHRALPQGGTHSGGFAEHGTGLALEPRTLGRQRWSPRRRPSVRTRGHGTGVTSLRRAGDSHRSNSCSPQLPSSIPQLSNSPPDPRLCLGTSPLLRVPRCVPSAARSRPPPGGQRPPPLTGPCGRAGRTAPSLAVTAPELKTSSPPLLLSPALWVREVSVFDCVQGSPLKARSTFPRRKSSLHFCFRTCL